MQNKFPDNSIRSKKKEGWLQGQHKRLPGVKLVVPCEQIAQVFGGEECLLTENEIANGSWVQGYEDEWPVQRVSRLAY